VYAWETTVFENLTDKLTSVFGRLGSKGRLTDDDLDTAMRDIRLALLEADVNFKVARELVAVIREKAIGTGVLKGISPGQQVVKIVHDELAALLGTGQQSLQPKPAPPSVILLVGLQGSGKTTTASKLALHLRRQGHRALLVAADLRRPAAVQQLETLGKQLNIPVYSEPKAGPDDGPKVAARGKSKAKDLGVMWCIVDTGGRLHLDKGLMAELEQMKEDLDPAETLMVLDAMTGQDAVNAAAAFHEHVGLSGLILAKLDGDARGGAALTATHITGVPVIFAGVGEKADALEPFHPERMASRILGMGDVLTLVEKAQEQIEEDEAQEMQRKLRRAQFDLSDFLTQLKAIKRMGPISSLMDMLPQAFRSKLPTQQANDGQLGRIEAIISSMTLWERRNPDKITGSRRSRVALGSGTTPTDVNQLLNQFKQMQKLMKQMAGGKRGNMAGMGLPKI